MRDTPQWCGGAGFRVLMIYVKAWSVDIGVGRVVRNRKGFQVYLRNHFTDTWRTVGLGFKTEEEAKRYVEVTVRMNPNFTQT